MPAHLALGAKPRKWSWVFTCPIMLVGLWYSRTMPAKENQSSNIKLIGMLGYFKGEVHGFLQNFMICRARGAESNGEGPRFVR